MDTTTATEKSRLLTGPFFEQFLSISYAETLIALLLLFGSFFIIYRLRRAHKSFFIQMSVGLILGAIIGLGLQWSQGFPEESTQILKESALWYGLFGRSFIGFIQMLVIPLVFFSIVKVIMDFANEQYLSKIASRGIFWMLFTTGIAAVLGIIIANLLGLGRESEAVVIENATQIREYIPLVDTLVNLIPRNIVQAMSGNNIIGLVLFSALIGLAANKVEKRTPNTVAPFKNFVDTFHQIVMQMTRYIIRLMPYAIIALLGGTIFTNGIPAIIRVSNFILAIYIATAVMIIIHILLVMMHGLSPLTFVKKSLDTWVMAFSSRSSVGTLPMTISTLTQRMGVSSGTANLIPSLGTTMGMNGCAGFFPALIVMMVAHLIGMEINAQFYIMLVIVVVLGSIGIAGIPGTATIAATVALSGMGLGEYFPLIGMVLAVDPIIDMGRTLTNVSGAMTAALLTDKGVGKIDLDRYNDPKAEIQESI